MIFRLSRPVKIRPSTNAFIDSKGKLRWIETIKTPIYDEKNKIIGTTGIARDITQRKQIEEKLIESEKNFRLMAENARDMIYRIRFIPRKKLSMSVRQSRLLRVIPWRSSKMIPALDTR